MLARVDAAFRAFVGDARFPVSRRKGRCAGDDHRLGVYGVLGSDAASDALAVDLAAFRRGLVPT